MHTGTQTQRSQQSLHDKLTGFLASFQHMDKTAYIRNTLNSTVMVCMVSTLALNEAKTRNIIKSFGGNHSLQSLVSFLEA